MLTEEEIDALKERHGEGLQLQEWGDGDDLVQVVIRPPNSIEWKRFHDESASEKLMRSTVVQNFVDPCVIYPDKDAWKAILQKLPGARVQLSPVLQEMAGAGAVARAKKL